jgi:hypothetical protein
VSEQSKSHTESYEALIPDTEESRSELRVFSRLELLDTPADVHERLAGFIQLGKKYRVVTTIEELE